MGAVKRLLQWMPAAFRLFRQSFHGGDFLSIGLHREHQAGAHRLTVEQHGAGAAHAVLAADVRAGQFQMMSQEITEQQAGFHCTVVVLPVNAEADGDSGRFGFGMAFSHRSLPRK